jgi:hypothetical protein
MRYKVGAEQVEQVPPLAHRPDEVVRSARTAPVGPTHAVDAATGAVACGINTDALEVLDQDWEAAFFVEKCPGCYAAVVAQSSAWRGSS